MNDSKGVRVSRGGKSFVSLFIAAFIILPVLSCRWIEIDHKPTIPDIVVTQKVPLAKEEKVTLSTTTGTLKVTVEKAIILLLQNNSSLMVDKINPAIQKTGEADARAVFDPTLTAAYSESRTQISRKVTSTTGVPPGPVTTDKVRVTNRARDYNGNVGISEFLPTGTTIDFTFTGDRAVTGGHPDNPNTAQTELSITQKLLKGFGLGVNLANLRQAKIDTQSSEYELRGFTLALVTQLEDAYWDYYLAQKQIKIFEESLGIAEAQLQETMERIKIGKLADTERFAAESEVASRREGLITTRAAMNKARLNLLQLLNPEGQLLRDRDVVLLSEPVLPSAPLADVDDHVALALRARPDLNQARLSVKRDDLDIVKTKNGLLPELDLFINLGNTGYANSFNRSTDDLFDGRSHSRDVGLQLNYALGNRAARADYRRSLLSREQSMAALSNMNQLAVQDVRIAYIEVNRVRELVTATQVTRKLQEQTLKTEREKFRVGKSTLLLVAQAERDLLSSQIQEVPGFCQLPEGCHRSLPSRRVAARTAGDFVPGG